MSFELPILSVIDCYYFFSPLITSSRELLLNTMNLLKLDCLKQDGDSILLKEKKVFVSTVH